MNTSDNIRSRAIYLLERTLRNGFVESGSWPYATGAAGEFLEEVLNLALELHADPLVKDCLRLAKHILTLGLSWELTFALWNRITDTRATLPSEYSDIERLVRATLDDMDELNSTDE